MRTSPLLCALVLAMWTAGSVNAMVATPGLSIARGDIVRVERCSETSVYYWLSLPKAVEAEMAYKTLDPLNVFVSAKSQKFPAIPNVNFSAGRKTVFLIAGQAGTKIRVAYPKAEDVEMVLKSFE